jgi:signal transduction histidine kinase
MLQGLLSYARAGHVTVPGEPVALGPAVADVLSDLTGLIADSGATVNVGVDSRASVWATPGDVRTVLQNLISNAVKFGDPQAPVVDIAAEPADDGTLYVTVKDNGAGVAEGDRERIFGAFERATPGAGQTGYGLGLAICQRLVARHGGQIGIDSGPRGSCVWFRIPVPPEVGVPAAGEEA